MRSLPPLISVIFVSYKRPHLLRETLSSFLANTDYPRDRLELIVADDGSDVSTQREIRGMQFDKYILADRNRGMGANTNAGISLATGEFILQLQDDWRCVGPRDWLKNAVAFFDKGPQVGLIRLRLPCSTPAQAVHIGESTMGWMYPKRQHRCHGEYGYTDNPHLKRKDFVAAIGPYSESLPMPQTELEYCARVDANCEWCVGFVGTQAVFEHIGEAETFNPCNIRARRIKTLERLPGGGLIVRVARLVKHKICLQPKD